MADFSTRLPVGDAVPLGQSGEKRNSAIVGSSDRNLSCCPTVLPSKAVWPIVLLVVIAAVVISTGVASGWWSSSCSNSGAETCDSLDSCGRAIVGIEHTAIFTNNRSRLLSWYSDLLNMRALPGGRYLLSANGGLLAVLDSPARAAPPAHIDRYDSGLRHVALLMNYSAQLETGIEYLNNSGAVNMKDTVNVPPAFFFRDPDFNNLHLIVRGARKAPKPYPSYTMTEELRRNSDLLLGIEHVAIVCMNVSAVTGWYVKYLGFSRHPDGSNFLIARDGLTMIEVLSAHHDGGIQYEKAAGLRQLSLAVDPMHIHSLAHVLARNGVEVVQRLLPGDEGLVSEYVVRDIEDNLVHLIARSQPLLH